MQFDRLNRLRPKPHRIAYEEIFHWWTARPLASDTCTPLNSGDTLRSHVRRWPPMANAACGYLREPLCEPVQELRPEVVQYWTRLDNATYLSRTPKIRTRGTWRILRPTPTAN